MLQRRQLANDFVLSIINHKDVALCIVCHLDCACRNLAEGWDAARVGSTCSRHEEDERKEAKRKQHVVVRVRLKDAKKQKVSLSYENEEKESQSKARAAVDMRAKGDRWAADAV